MFIKLFRIKLIKIIFKGLIGGSAALVVGHPLDTVKALMQTSHQAGMISSAKIIFKNTTVKGYFRGLGMPFLSYGPLNSLLFGIYGNTLRFLEPNKQNDNQSNSHSILNVWIAGTVSGSLLAPVTNPFELVKIQLQTSNKKELKGISDCIRYIVKNDGYKGLLRGFNALFLRDSLSYGFYFGVFEFLRRNIKKHSEEKEFVINEMIVDFISGGISGSLAWFLILPLDIVKTRQQATKGKNLGIMETMKIITKEHGIKAHFTLGLAPLILRGFLVNATTFVFYIQSLKILENI